MKKSALFFLCAFLLSCSSTGPKSALDHLATALENNNPSAFIGQFDMQAYAKNEIANMTRNDNALNVINSFGKLLGLGNVDDLISSIVDVKSQLDANFTRQVVSGELVAQCRVATTPDCPWEPASLRSASVIEINPQAAIAKVTTPARLTSWICLHKIDDKWLVVGKAVLEAEARAIALEPASAPARPASDQKKLSI